MAETNQEAYDYLRDRYDRLVVEQVELHAEAAALRENLAEVDSLVGVIKEKLRPFRNAQNKSQEAYELASRYLANAEPCGTCAGRRVVCGRFSANQMAAGAPGEPCPDCAEPCGTCGDTGVMPSRTVGAKYEKCRDCFPSDNTAYRDPDCAEGEA